MIARTVSVLGFAFLLLSSSCVAFPKPARPDTFTSLYPPANPPNRTLHAFPPGIPPATPFLYPLPYSNVAIKFTRYRLSRDHEESAAGDVIFKARVVGSDPTLRNRPLPNKILTWASGDMKLMVGRSGGQEGGEVLTWGELVDALVGVDGFRLAYPELDVWFDLLVPDRGLDPRKPWAVVGNGALFCTGAVR